MKTSEQTNEIFKALAEAQKELRNPEKNKTVTVRTNGGSSYSFDYADLPSIFDSVRVAFARNGLAHLTGMGLEDGKQVISARITHSSGQWVESSMALHPAQQIKDLGGNITYQTRYLFAALIGIAADDDVDSDPVNTESFTDRSKQSPTVTPVVAVAAHQKAAPLPQPSTPGDRAPSCSVCGMVMRPSKPEYGGGWYCPSKDKTKKHDRIKATESTTSGDFSFGDELI